MQNEKKSKIPKLCQDIGLDELFLEKYFEFDLIFILGQRRQNRFGGSHIGFQVFSRRPHHTLLERRPKINTRANPTIKHHNQKNAYLGTV